MLMDLPSHTFKIFIQIWTQKQQVHKATCGLLILGKRHVILSVLILQPRTIKTTRTRTIWHIGKWITTYCNNKMPTMKSFTTTKNVPWTKKVMCTFLITMPKYLKESEFWNVKLLSGWGKAWDFAKCMEQRGCLHHGHIKLSLALLKYVIDRWACRGATLVYIKKIKCKIDYGTWGPQKAYFQAYTSTIMVQGVLLLQMSGGHGREMLF